MERVGCVRGERGVGRARKWKSTLAPRSCCPGWRAASLCFACAVAAVVPAAAVDSLLLLEQCWRCWRCWRLAGAREEGTNNVGRRQTDWLVVCVTVGKVSVQDVMGGWVGVDSERGQLLPTRRGKPPQQNSNWLQKVRDVVPPGLTLQPNTTNLHKLLTLTHTNQTHTQTRTPARSQWRTKILS